jgi:hypothetical protein
LENSNVAPEQGLIQEDSAARAMRLTELVRVRLKESMTQSAVSQALLYWLRSDGVKSA